MWESSSENSGDDDNFYMRSQNESSYDLPQSTEEFNLKTPSNVLSASLLAVLDNNPLQATVADQIRTSEDYNNFVFSQSQQSQKDKKVDAAEDADKVSKRRIVSCFKKINEKSDKKQYTNTAVALNINPLQPTVPDQIKTSENYNDFVFSQIQQSQMDDATIKKKQKKEDSCAENSKEKVLDCHTFLSPRLESDNAANDLTNQLFSQFRNVLPINNSSSEAVSKSESILTIDTFKLTQMSTYLDELQENNQKNKLDKNKSNMNVISKFSMEDLDDFVNTTFTELVDKRIKSSPKNRKSKSPNKKYKKKNQETNPYAHKDNSNKVEDGRTGNKDMNIANKENIDETVNRNKKKHKKHDRSKEKHKKHDRSKERSDSAKRWTSPNSDEEEEDSNNKQVTSLLESLRNSASPEKRCKASKRVGNQENFDKTVKGKKKKHKKSNSYEKSGKLKKGNKSDPTKRHEEIEKEVQCETEVCDIKTNTTVSVSNSPSAKEKSKKSKILFSMSQTECADVEENLMPNLKIKDSNECPKNIQNLKKRDHTKEHSNNENTDSEKKAIQNTKCKLIHSNSDLGNSYIDSESVDEIVSPTKKRKIMADSTDSVISVTKEEDDENIHKKCKKSDLRKHKKKKRKRESCDSDSNYSCCDKKLKVVCNQKAEMEGKTKLLEDRKLIEKHGKEQKLITDNKNVVDEEGSSYKKRKLKLESISGKRDEDKSKRKSNKSKSKLKEKCHIVSKQFVDVPFDKDDQVITSRMADKRTINGQNLDELLNDIINESCSQIDAKLLDSAQLSTKKRSKSKKRNKDKQDKKERKEQFRKKHKKHSKAKNNGIDSLSKSNEMIDETKSVKHEKENDDTEHSMKKKSKKSRKEKKEQNEKRKRKKVCDESEKTIGENSRQNLNNEKQDNDIKNVTSNCRQNEANLTDSEVDLIHINKNLINNEESVIAHPSNSMKQRLEIEIMQEYDDAFLTETNNVMNKTSNLSIIEPVSDGNDEADKISFSRCKFLPVPEELEYVKPEYAITAEDEEILRYLTVYKNFKIPPLHQLATNITRGPTKEVMAQFKECGLECKTGTYNPDETKIILNNWHEFCKKHRIQRKPELFMNLNQKGADNKRLILKNDALSFTQWLARGLPNRLLFSVYRKFQNMFRFYKRGKFTPEEDEIILETLTSAKNMQGIFIRLGILLDRKPNAVEKHYIALRENQNHAFKEERIGIDEAANIVKTLMEVMGCQDVGELRNKNNIPFKIFTEVGKKLHVRPLKIQQYWYNNLHPKLFVTGTRSLLQVKIQLLKLILANPEYTLLQHVDYNKLLPEMDGWTPIALGKLLRNIINGNPRLQKGQAFREQLEICLTDLSSNPERLKLKVARFKNGKLYFKDP